MNNKKVFITINKMVCPILVSSLADMLFNIADQAIIGRTSVEGFAAVSVVANLIYLLTGSIGAISIAFAILFGRAIGEGDRKKQSAIFSNAISLAIIIGIVFGIASVVLGRTFLGGIYGLKANVLEYAYDYLVIACWGLGLNLIIFLFSAYFKHLKKSTISMIANIVSLGINLIIDYVLVFGKFGFPRLGVSGAAIGTIAGLSINVIIFIFMFLKHRIVDFRFRLNIEEIRKLTITYLPIFGEDFVECTLLAMAITSFVTRMDTYFIATYNMLEIIIAVIILPTHAYGGVVMTLVSQKYSNLSKSEIARYPKMAVLCGIAFVVIMGSFILMYPQVMEIITDDARLVDIATNVCIFAICIQLLNVPNQIYKYALQSTGQERWIFRVSTVCAIISCLIIYLLIHVLDMGLYSIYFGLGIMYSILFVLYMRKIS